MSGSEGKEGTGAASARPGPGGAHIPKPVRPVVLPETSLHRRNSHDKSLC